MRDSPIRRRFPGLLLAAALAASPMAAAVEPSAAITAPVPPRAVGSALPDGWQHGAFAEIYVRGYRDSDGDGIGDLRGLTGQLDYLRWLGVRGIWLMPVSRSADHDHGYAVEDYRDIEADYGTLADFDELLAQAHARGIGVIVDYVINHSADSHPLFLAGAGDRGSPYRRWYLWREVAPKGWSIFERDPWVVRDDGSYLAQFSPRMPDFDLRAPGVMAWHADNLRFWLNRGVDGFRFDAVAHLVENGPNHWRDQPEAFRLANEASGVALSYPRRYVVCEATREAERWAAADACGSAFAFELGSIALAAARGEREAIGKLARYFESAPPSMATMLANHDRFAGDRVWNQLGGDEAQYRLAAASYLLAPGTPFIYYGEEIGMAAVASLRGDPGLRTPMSWNTQANAGFSTATPFRPLSPNARSHNVAAQRRRGDSLLAWYRRLLGLRNDIPALARGRYEGARVDDATWSYRRVLDGQVALVAINYGTAAATLELRELGAGRRFEQRLPRSSSALLADESGAARLRLPAQSVAVYVSADAR